jgi:hypothetical protein
MQSITTKSISSTKNKHLGNFLPSQRGLALGSLIFNLVLLTLAALVVIKIGSLYADNYTVNKALQELDDVPFITKKSSREISDILEKRFRMDNTPIDRSEIFVDKRPDRLIVEVNYERRIDLISNIDVILSFENKYETVNR